MKILITGATGFVGRNLVPYLFSHGFVELAIAVRDPQKGHFANRLLILLLR